MFVSMVMKEREREGKRERKKGENYEEEQLKGFLLIKSVAFFMQRGLVVEQQSVAKVTQERNVCVHSQSHTAK